MTLLYQLPGPRGHEGLPGCVDGAANPRAGAAKMRVAYSGSGRGGRRRREHRRHARAGLCGNQTVSLGYPESSGTSTCTPSNQMPRDLRRLDPSRRSYGDNFHTASRSRNIAHRRARRRLASSAHRRACACRRGGARVGRAFDRLLRLQADKEVGFLHLAAPTARCAARSLRWRRRRIAISRFRRRWRSLGASMVVARRLAELQRDHSR